MVVTEWQVDLDSRLDAHADRERERPPTIARGRDQDARPDGPDRRLAEVRGAWADYPADEGLPEP